MDAAAAAASLCLAPDLKKRVEIMAEHVAKNGQGFESTVRSKNANNPQFQFLAGGEGSEYYQALLATHHTPSAPSAPESTADDLEELMRRWPTPQVMPLIPEHDRQLTEILTSLERSASREAIAKGRGWIEAHVDMAPVIASNMMKRVVFLSSSLHRLHVLYLLHDLFINEAGRQDPVKPLIAAFKPCLVWIVRPTFQIAQSVMPDSEGCAKIRKLLAMWVEKAVLSSQEAADVSVLMSAKDLPSPPTGRLLQQVGAQMGMAMSQMQQHSLVGSILGALNPGTPGVMPGPVPHGTLHAAHGAHGTQIPAPMVPAALAVPLAPGAVHGLPQAAGTLALPSGVLALPSAATENPETVPVGIMASMLRQVSRRGKDLHAAWVPYRPLDPFYTPQVHPPTPAPGARLLERLAQYYRKVGDSAKMPKAEPKAEPEPSELKERSRSRSRGRAFGAVPPPLD